MDSSCFLPQHCPPKQQKLMVTVKFSDPLVFKGPQDTTTDFLSHMMELSLGLWFCKIRQYTPKRKRASTFFPLSPTPPTLIFRWDTEFQIEGFLTFSEILSIICLMHWECIFFIFSCLAPLNRLVNMLMFSRGQVFLVRLKKDKGLGMSVSGHQAPKSLNPAPLNI